MHTGPLPMSYVPDNDDCTDHDPIPCDGDTYTDAEIEAFDIETLTGLSPREAWEFACWELANGYAAGVL